MAEGGYEEIELEDRYPEIWRRIRRRVMTLDEDKLDEEYARLGDIDSMKVREVGELGCHRMSISLMICFV